MKFSGATQVRERSGKRILDAAGTGLLSVLTILRLARGLLRPARTKQPPDEPDPLTRSLARAADDTPPARPRATRPPLPPPPLTEPLRGGPSSARKRNRTLALFVIALLISIPAATFFYPPKPAYYFAYVGKYQRPGSSFDDLHERALRRYIDELNAVLPDYRFELKTFSTNVGGGEFDSRKVYEEIAGDEKYVVVFDNTWGSDLRGVADLIKARGIPVVSINADHQGVDYSRNVVFIGYDDAVPEKVVKFASDILKDKEVVFITEESYPLTHSFEEQFAANGITKDTLSVKSSAFVPDKLPDLLARLDAQLEGLRQRRESPTVVLNVHSHWGGPIIEHIDRNFRNVTILGGPYIIPSSEFVFGSNDNGNRLIMFTYPHDGVTNRVFKDLEGIEAGNPAVSSIANAPLFVKRCLDAVSIIGGGVRELPGRKDPPSREDFLNFFHKKLAAGVPVAGHDDLYSFDGDLLLSDVRSFEERFRGRVFSYESQLNQKNEVVPNLYFGLSHIEISDVNMRTRSFHADFLFWVTSSQRHQDITNNIIFRNQIGADKPERIPVENADEGRAYYKVSGEFSMDVDLRRYPFDTQELKVALQIINPTALPFQISYVHGRESITLNDGEWSKKGVRVMTDNVIVSSPGEGASLEDERPRKIKTLNLRVEISRHRWSLFIAMILPFVLMGCVGIAVLYVEDSSFANVGNVCVGIFLGMVAYSLAFIQMTPRSNVLTTADKVFYATLFAVLLIFLKVIIFNSSMTGVMSKRVLRSISDKPVLVGNVAEVAYLLIIGAILIFG